MPLQIKPASLKESRAIIAESFLASFLTLPAGSSRTFVEVLVQRSRAEVTLRAIKRYHLECDQKPSVSWTEAQYSSAVAGCTLGQLESYATH